MSDYGAPQSGQRDAITMALMGIANPTPHQPAMGMQTPGAPQRMPQLPGMPGAAPPPTMPTNISGGLTAIGNAIGGMGQPQQPGAPMSLAPPAPPQPQPQAPQAPGPQGVY